jgi:hypothetical protein
LGCLDTLPVISSIQPNNATQADGKYGESGCDEERGVAAVLCSLLQSDAVWCRIADVNGS